MSNEAYFNNNVSLSWLGMHLRAASGKFLLRVILPNTNIIFEEMHSMFHPKAFHTYERL